MVEGTVRKLDRVNRMAVIETSDGKEVTLRFPEDLAIEVAEEETMGTIAGTLEDLQEGYLVEFEHAELEDGSCTCDSLTCIS
ncbi:MAG: hypothetical protein ACE5I9_05300 [Candidatus Methylomirabilales bacterium]